MAKGKKVEPEELELGTCVQCGQPRVVRMQRGVPLSYYTSDEFCSTVCAKLHYGVIQPSDPKPKEPSK